MPFRLRASETLPAGTTVICRWRVGDVPPETSPVIGSVTMGDEYVDLSLPAGKYWASSSVGKNVGFTVQPDEAAIVTPALDAVRNDDPRLSDARAPLPHDHVEEEVVGLPEVLAEKITADDPRLTDQRPPLPHVHQQADVVGLGPALTGKVDATDTRLTDARIPVAHSHSQSDITGLATTLSGKASTSDPRLSDARTPLAHSHPQSDITGLASSLAGKQDTSAKGQPNGYAGLDASGLIPSSVLPSLGLSAPDATALTKGVVQLAGDLAGTAAAPTVPGLASKVATTDPRLSDARTPLAHTHAQSEVTGLVTALAGKASSVHSHVRADITDFAHTHPFAEVTGVATTAQLPAIPDSKLASPNNAVYRTLTEGSGAVIAAAAAGTRALGHNAIAVSGTNGAFPVALFYLAAADYAVTGLTTRLRVKAQLATNAVAPTGTWTFGLHPVTATGGVAGGITYTLGAAVAGSTAAFTTPAASSRLQAVSGDVALPADGFYVLGLVTTAAVATSAYVAVNALLQIRST